MNQMENQFITKNENPISQPHPNTKTHRMGTSNKAYSRNLRHRLFHQIKVLNPDTQSIHVLLWHFEWEAGPFHWASNYFETALLERDRTHHFKKEIKQKLIVLSTPNFIFYQRAKLQTKRNTVPSLSLSLISLQISIKNIRHKWHSNISEKSPNFIEIAGGISNPRWQECTFVHPHRPRTRCTSRTGCSRLLSKQIGSIQ